MEKEAKKFREYEGSLDGIMHDLSIWGDTTSEDEKNKLIIAKTLQRLPRRVREKVIDEVAFVIMTDYGAVWKIRLNEVVNKEDFRRIGEFYDVTVEKVGIFLNFIKRHSESYYMNLIAHEIAHFILENFYPAEYRKGYNPEKAADDLSQKWGFQRFNKSYDL
jgi:hypothetical protein